MFYQSMMKSSSKRKNPQFFPNQFRSIDGMAQQESALPSINANSGRKRLPVKSPVMESIRMSRNLKSKNFMNLTRGGDSPSRYNSDDDDVSQTSKMTSKNF